MLSVTDLRYQRKNFELHIPKLEIKIGEKVALIGHNGSGKTTLMESILGLLPVTGNLKVLGRPMTKGNGSLLSKISYCMQNPDDQLFCATVRDDILFAPKNFKLDMRREEILEKVSKVIDVEKFLGRAPFELSYGEKKSCSLAVALATNPDLLILDEPFAMLDRRQKGKILTVLRSLNQTMLVSGHEWDFISEFCRRMIVLKAGQIVFDGDISYLANKSQLEAWDL